jgi:hypothetical protein
VAKEGNLNRERYIASRFYLTALTGLFDANTKPGLNIWAAKIHNECLRSVSGTKDGNLNRERYIRAFFRAQVGLLT